MIQIPDHIEALRPYVPGKPVDELKREKGLSHIVKLASNENPLGASPKALEAIQDHLKQIHIYPSAGGYSLVQALSQKLKIPPEQIICGSGIDSLLGYIICAFTKPQDEILTSQGTFIGLYVNANKYHRPVTRIPLQDYAYDLTAIAKSISTRTRLIYLANPNNPTGTLFNKPSFEAFMKRVPKDVLVILDEAYYSFAASDPAYPNGLDTPFDHLLVTRTFSKDYGLAGLRVGYAVGPTRLINTLYKVKLPFEPSHLAQHAAAAALSDDDFLKRTLQTTQESLKQMIVTLKQLGIPTVPSSANFLMMHFPDEATAFRFQQASLHEGLILRHLKAFGIPEGVRISAGTSEETRFALDTIERVIKNI